MILHSKMGIQCQKEAQMLQTNMRNVLLSCVVQRTADPAKKQDWGGCHILVFSQQAMHSYC